jgi:hypothetical protein
LHLALHDCGVQLQAALASTDHARATALSAQVLQRVAAACAAQAAVPINDAWVQALVLEVTWQPLVAQDDGTLVENLLDVWIDHRAWQVERAAMPGLFEHLLTGLRAASQAVAWSYRSTSQGRAAIQAWAPLSG